MKISAIPLENVVDVNSWNHSDYGYIYEGQANSLFVQLTLPNKSECFRYLSQATAISVNATFDSIDDSEKITITGTSPFSDDKSIWKFDIPSGQIPKSGAIQIQLIEDGVIRNFVVRDFISTELLSIGGC